MTDLLGKEWGRFQIVEERGRGGMAVVYKAHDTALQRTVAVKVLLPLLAANKEFTRRFRREAITAANLKHPHIVVIHDVGSHDGFQYIVMEYLDGPTVQQEIQQTGAMSITRVSSLLGQLAGALDYAHQHGLVHRDVKPANIIIGAHDCVTLTDFGLVKAARSTRITGEGSAVGTLKYMSPEQAQGIEIDARSDIYSLGVVVYEMLSGETPFAGTTPYQILQQLIYKPPPPLSLRDPQIPEAVESVVLQALAKEPDRRFSTAGEFAQALVAASGHESQTGSTQRQVTLLLIAPDGREHPLFPGKASIGRDIGNDIVLPINQVSRHHAQIQCGPAECTVTDMGSTNGTSVNGASLVPSIPQALRQGDMLGIGPIVLMVTQPCSSSGSDTETLSIDLNRS